MPLQLDIVTPEKKVFSDMVDNVYLPGADGVRARDEAERMGAADLVALFAETP